jgi:hypothetical protein
MSEANGGLGITIKKKLSPERETLTVMAKVTINLFNFIE